MLAAPIAKLYKDLVWNIPTPNLTIMLSKQITFHLQTRFPFFFNQMFNIEG